MGLPATTGERRISESSFVALYYSRDTAGSFDSSNGGASKAPTPEKGGFFCSGGNPDKPNWSKEKMLLLN